MRMVLPNRWNAMAPARCETMLPERTVGGGHIEEASRPIVEPILVVAARARVVCIRNVFVLAASVCMGLLTGAKSGVLLLRDAIDAN